MARSEKIVVVALLLLCWLGGMAFVTFIPALNHPPPKEVRAFEASVTLWILYPFSMLAFGCVGTRAAFITVSIALLAWLAPTVWVWAHL